MNNVYINIKKLFKNSIIYSVEMYFSFLTFFIAYVFYNNKILLLK